MTSRDASEGDRTRARQPPRPRGSVASLTGYAWEESSEAVAARLGIDVADVVRFDLNTVPWQGAVVSADDAYGVNEYPDMSYRELTQAIAAYCDVPERAVVVGAGGDELISLLAQTYLDHGRTYTISDPTYLLFSITADATGATRNAVPCDEGFAMDRERFLAAAATADVTWVANPNNPTGEELPQDFLREVAASAGGLVVIDEAYAEFATASSLQWFADAPNVVVLRTLSKAFGLAGMRVGYLLAARDVVTNLEKLRPVSSISVVSARLGARALGAAGRMRENVARLSADRHRLAQELSARGVPVIEGAANFVLARLDAATVERAQTRGLLLRTYGEGHRLDGWSRITVRSPAENARLLDAVRPR